MLLQKEVDLPCFRGLGYNCQLIKLILMPLPLEDQTISNKSQLHVWQLTNHKHIIRLLGLLGYMRIVQMNSIRHYWSIEWIFRKEVALSVMSRSKFELLLKMLDFFDNSHDKTIKSFQAIYPPCKMFCIEKSRIPFQGGLLFRQYNQVLHYSNCVQKFRYYHLQNCFRLDKISLGMWQSVCHR